MEAGGGGEGAVVELAEGRVEGVVGGGEVEVRESCGEGSACLAAAWGGLGVGVGFDW